MEKGYVYVNSQIYPTLLAISEDEQAQGLMHKSWPPPVMSFVYNFPRVNKFWMKNTPSPLDIVFCFQGKVQQICTGSPHSTSIIGNDNLSDLVIEFPYGTVESSKIKLGQSALLVKPNPEELRKIIAEKYHRIVKI